MDHIIILGPHNNSWGVDYRRISGGVGGHPLSYAPSRVFLGGGGGGGHGNDGYGGIGGTGGGAVFLNLYGDVTGSGTISANGGNGENAEGPDPTWSEKTGDDGAGGAGGGGSVIIKNINALPASLNLEAKGGNGGDQVLKRGMFNNNNQADGPGGGGAGGLIAFSLGTPNEDVSGGIAGETNSSYMANFPVNGASGGAEGMASQSTEMFDFIAVNDTICEGEIATLVVSVVGGFSQGTGFNWYDAAVDGNYLNSGATFTTPVLTTTTTYYVGTCPGTFRVPVTAVVSPAIVITGTPVIVDETCAGNDGSITGLTATGGTGTYTYDWNGNSTASEDLSNVVGGTFTLTVTDDVGCSETAGPFIISASAGPVIDISNVIVMDESCNGNDGSVTGITVSGGAPSYTYTWNGNASSGAAIAGVSGGTYTLVVTDNNGCATTAGPFTVNAGVPIVIDATNISINDESCNGNDGSISGITASGGTGALTYSWSPSSFSTPDISGMGSGNYTLTVSDGAGCSVTSGPHTINQNAGPTFDDANILISDEACGLGNGSITGITATGTGMSYAWSPSGATTLDANGLTNGSHTLVITDGAGCSISAGPYSINNNAGPIIDASGVATVDETCNGNDGSITGITFTGGTAPFTFDWSGTATTSQDLNNTVGGTYTLIITDVNGCTATAGPYTLIASPGPVMNVSTMIINEESCNGNDGNITGITISGGATPYAYAWNGNSSTGTDLLNLTGGTYTLVVTDNNGCTTTGGPFTINTASPILIDVSNLIITDESCNGSDGAINGITTSGGTGTLTYSWSPSLATTIDLSTLINGNYTLTVTDAFGCSETSGPHTVNQVAGPTFDDANIAITDASCGVGNGSITGITTTGTGLSYAWSSSGVTTLDANNLTNGAHTLIITDGAGCTVTAGPYTVNDLAAPVIDASALNVTDETCNGNDGAITGITFTGGTAPYSYDWSGTTTTSQDLSNAIGGAYTFTLTDGNGCTATAGPYTINTTTGPSVNISGMNISDETCDQNDGSISGITISGGATPYTYSWNGNSSTNTDLTGVSGGSYSLEVTDNNGCATTTGPFNINGATAIVVDATNVIIQDESCSGNDGSITGILVSGGTGALTYSWSSGGTGVDLMNASNGTYTLTITDGLGCTETSGPHTINQTPGPIVDDANIILNDESCGLGNGSITGIEVVGTGLTYAWSPSGITTLDASNLSNGTYTLVITNGAGCTVSAGPYTISNTPGPVLDLSGINITPENCLGNNGSITGITVSGGTGPYTMSWGGAVTSTPDLMNINGGTYSLLVLDANGCSASAGPYTITSPSIPDVSISTGNQTIPFGDSLDIHTTVTPANSTLFWSPADGLSCNNCLDPVASPSFSTWYVLTAISPDGCVDSDSVFIEVEDPCGKIKLPTVFTPNGDGLNDDFCVLGNCIQSMRLQIFNRWGELVFETTEISDCWDGTFRGEPASTGVFIYKLNGVDKNGKPISLAGNVNLLR